MCSRSSVIIKRGRGAGTNRRPARRATIPKAVTRNRETDGRAVVIIGGGPAGLTAAHELCKAGLRPVVLERSRSVGGLARTAVHKGFRFDIGGHRFYTKSEEAASIWPEVLPPRG